MPSQNGRKPQFRDVSPPKVAPKWFADEGFAHAPVVDWEELIPAALGAAVDATTSAGCLFMFARTKEDGNLKVGILWEGRSKWWFPTCAEDINDICRKLASE